MIEISFAKLVLLALVALIVLGPEKLPGAARTAGALLRRVRSGWDSVRSEVERELEVEEIRRAAREAAARAEAAQAEFRQSVDEVETAVKQAGEAARAQVQEAEAAVSADAPASTTTDGVSSSVDRVPPPDDPTVATPIPAPDAAEPDPQQELPLFPAPPAKEPVHGGH